MTKPMAAAPRRGGPVSVVLTHELQRRIGSEGKRRGLKLSPALRVLVTERLEQLEDEERQTAAEAWQRQQAWASWEKLQSGPPKEATVRQLAAVFGSARRKRA